MVVVVVCGLNLVETVDEAPQIRLRVAQLHLHAAVAALRNVVGLIRVVLDAIEDVPHVCRIASRKASTSATRLA